MPVSSLQKMQLGKSLSLKMDNGYNEKGENIYTSKSFSNVSEEASDAAIYNTAHILADLQEKDLAEVSVTEKSILLG